MMPMLQKVKAGGMAIGDENGIIRVIAVMETTFGGDLQASGGNDQRRHGHARDEKSSRQTPRAFMQGHSITRGKDDLDRNEIILRGPHGPP